MSEAPVLRRVPELRRVMVQTVRGCNCRCVICPMGSNRHPVRLMPQELYEKILSQCAQIPTIEAFMPYLMSEPLLDPDLERRLQQAREQLPVGKLFVVTNGLNLPGPRARALMEHLDELHVSINAWRASSVERLTGRSDWLGVRPLLLETIADAIARRGTSFVKVSVTRAEPLLEPGEIEELEQAVRAAGVTRLKVNEAPISRAGNISLPWLAEVEHPVVTGCTSIWVENMAHILCDGSVIPCCHDYRERHILGNVAQEPIDRIWTGERYSRFRRAVAGQERLGELICLRCELAATTTGRGPAAPSPRATSARVIAAAWSGSLPASQARLCWTEELLVALLEGSGLQVERVEPGDGARPARGRGEPDLVFAHLHPLLDLSRLQQSLPSAAHPAVLGFGGFTVAAEHHQRLQAAGIAALLRGLPAPSWLPMIEGSLGAGDRQGVVLGPVLPDWQVLPGGAFRTEQGTVLVRTSLGRRDRPAWSGAVAYEGPFRQRAPSCVAAEVQQLSGSGEVREVVVADLPSDLRDPGELDRWRSILESLEKHRCSLAWTLPVVALTSDPSSLERLHDLGLRRVRLHLAAVSDEACRHLGATAGPAEVAGSLRAAAAAGISCELALSIGAPGEDCSSGAPAALAWLAPVAELVEELTVTPFAPEAGSRMAIDPERFGIWWPPGESYGSWVNRQGSNLSQRARSVAELAAASERLGIPRAATTTPEPASVRRHRDRIVQRLSPGRGESGDEAEATAEQGPRLVEIELAAACNLRCIGCWCHSPRLPAARHQEHQQASPLPTARLLHLLEELAGMQVEEVQLSGSGEPLMNRDAVEIVAHASRLGLGTTLVTNATLLTPEVAERLAEAGLDRVTASVWAGDATTYQLTHPGVPAEAFAVLSSNLATVAGTRRQHGRPRLKIFNVISKRNARSIETMVDHALATGADELELQIIDTGPETADLALSTADADHIEQTLSRLAARPEFTALWRSEPPLRPGAPEIVRQELQEFGRFFRLGELPFQFEPDGRLRCRNGLHSQPARAIEDRQAVFAMPRERCLSCDLSPSCFPTSAVGELRLPTLELVGVGSFRRRLSSAESRAMEREILLRIPCAVGSQYSRIDYRGNVIGCCKGSANPLGNVREASFRSVWTSPGYRQFRHNTLHLRKDHPYFEPIGCLSACDNLGMSLRAQYDTRAATAAEADQERR